MNIWQIFEMLGVESDIEHPYEWIDNLIHNSTLPEDTKTDMEYFNNEDCPEEVMVIMMQQLLMNQPDRIGFGMSYNQGDIKRKLDSHE